MREREQLVTERKEVEIEIFFLLPLNGVISSSQAGCFSWLRVMSSLTFCLSSPLLILGSNKCSLPVSFSSRNGSISTVPCPKVLHYSLWLPDALHTHSYTAHPWSILWRPYFCFLLGSGVMLILSGSPNWSFFAFLSFFIFTDMQTCCAVVSTLWEFLLIQH